MTAARNHPWLVSLAVHALLAALVLVLVRVPETPPPVRMHFAVSGAAKTSRTALNVPGAPAARPTAPELPSWTAHSAPSAVHAPPAAPVSLDELLGGLPETEAPPAPAAATGWVSEGYAPPPLPPPSLAPPQGAAWTLVIDVPGGGGPGAATGLESGHPELDRWLETYLRTVSFPPSLDGQPYQLHWNLTLISDRPR